MPEIGLFPLPLVLMPTERIPLHIFEPRYRQLISDVLDGDREFGVTLITRGHEVGGGDQRADVGTVARVLQAEELEDGRWLVVSVGVHRVRVVEWLDDRLYPAAVVEEFADEELSAPSLAGGTEARLRRVLAMHAELGYEGVPATFELEEDPAVASWQVAIIAPLTPYDAQRVLATADAATRVRLLDELLRDLEELLGLQLGEHD